MTAAKQTTVASTATRVDPVYDPFSEGFYVDPYPTYARLRDEHPVYHSELYDFWVVSRFEDARAVARDSETFSVACGIDIGEQITASPGFITDIDNPRHDQLRQIVQRSFLPRSIAKLEDDVRRVVRELSDAMLAEGEFDLSQELAWPIPLEVFFDLLGLPTAGSDRAMLVRWLHELKDREPGNPGLTQVARDALSGSEEYLAAMLEERRTRPRSDLLSTIATAEVDGEPFAKDVIKPGSEIVGLTFALYLAGIETTAGLITNVFKLLAEHPDQRAALRRDPSLIPNAVDETVRYDGVLQAVRRVLTRPATLQGTTIPAGDRVIVVYAAANRDGRAFERADSFDVTRPRQRHLGFGEGMHGCLGSHLARLEARVAVEEVLPRIGDYEITSEPVLYPSTPNARSYHLLPLRPGRGR